MNNAGRRERREGGDPEPGADDTPWWAVGLGIAAGVTAVAGGIYLLSQTVPEQRSEDSDEEHAVDYRNHRQDMDNFNDSVSRLAITSSPRVNNLNSLLIDIHTKYIKLEDFKDYYDVFMKVFYPLHECMKTADAYYERFSSRVQFAGSHYDGLRVKKPDEFDMDIVIDLPVNLHENFFDPEKSDIIIEAKHPGYVQLCAGPQYQKIPERNDYDINKQAYFWLDEKKYILRSKFISWFKSVVDRALNKFMKLNGYPAIQIGKTMYMISMSSSGPAYTLRITNPAGFKLDVDLVPALRFPEERWLARSTSYRAIPPSCSADYWMVVPKPNKFGANSFDEDRSWRVAMHDQEKKLIYNSYHLRSANRLLKKLRDAQQMNHIKSYYIKTLFLWKISELNDPYFWQGDVATIFKVMLREFHNALVAKKISYFWNRKHNMIEKVPEHILKGYANKLSKLLTKLEDDRKYMWAAKYLLTGSEYAEYEETLGVSACNSTIN